MAIIAWSEHFCPHCGRKLGEQDIVNAHHTGTCPGCKHAVMIDAKAALQKSPMAALIAVVTIGVGALVWSVILGAAGIDDDFFKSRTWPEPKLTAGIVPMLLLGVIVASTVAGALLTVKAYVRKRLSANQALH